MLSFVDDITRQIKRYRHIALNNQPNSFEDLFNLDQHEKIMKMTLDKNIEGAKQLLDGYLERMRSEIEPTVNSIEMA
jgi:DNA-binding GntR family transcriptional regulator